MSTLKATKISKLNNYAIRPENCFGRNGYYKGIYWKTIYLKARYEEDAIEKAIITITTNENYTFMQPLLDL
jgi:hypothetical protein